MSKFKKALIIPYFGKFNNYFNLWLISAGYNNDYDFLIFTDDKTEYDYPSNVKVFYSTIEEVRKRAQMCFDFTIALGSPYKLCDYKPCYGEMFKEELKDYDFWGYCDVDLIFGHLSDFYTDDILDKYDKISDAGHYTLYKNNDELRAAYKTLHSEGCLDYYEVYTHEQNYAFDEWGQNRGINRILINNGYKIYFKPIWFSDIKVNTYGLISTSGDYDLEERATLERKKSHFCYTFQDGKVIQHSLVDNKCMTTEVAYLHLQKRPMMNKVTKSIKEFVVLPPNIFSVIPEKIDESFLKTIKENKVYWHWYNIRWNNLKRKFRKIIKK